MKLADLQPLQGVNDQYFEMYLSFDVREYTSGSTNQHKSGKFYLLINPYINGVRKPKWIKTDLPIKGNLTRASKLLKEATSIFDANIKEAHKLAAQLNKTPQRDRKAEGLDEPFVDFLYRYLAHKRKATSGKVLEARQIDLTTYAGYAQSMSYPIDPYFRDKGFTLGSITRSDIKEFYEKQLERVKPATVKHYHAFIHGAFVWALQDLELITYNPISRMLFPPIDKKQSKYYNVDEAKKLFEAVMCHKMELPVLIATFYGLRRSEVVGLKWDAFDFTNNSFIIKHTVTQCRIDGKIVIVEKDKGKSEESVRSLPLVPYFRERLLAAKEKQEEYQRICGNCYNKKYLDYVCVDPLGDRLLPNYITGTHTQLLKKHGLRQIRYHDLRHTCAYLLLNNGVPLERVKQWLGHSDVNTTDSFYGHWEYQSKVESADVMGKALLDALPSFIKESNEKGITPLG